MTTGAVPRRVRPRTDVNGLDGRCFGDDYMWGAGVPLLYRALAAPGGDEAVLAAPEPSSRYSDPHEALGHACAYWGALLHLLVYSFGWTRPERGLLTWLDAGCPDEDPRLRLLAATYWRDQQLQAMIVWLLTSAKAPEGVWRDLGRRRGLQDHGRDLRPELRRALSELPLPPRDVRSPHSKDGGADPLHLSRHLGDGLADTEHRGALCVADPERRTAVFTHPSMIGWYGELCRRGDDLQIDRGPSWRIDVHVRTVGFIGTYRRSRRTNIWFAGRHRYHDWGNPSGASTGLA